MANAHHDGPSIQVVKTPPDFMAAFKKRFWEPQTDLAASPDNAQAPYFLSERDDALADRWKWHELPGGCWLNPPFKHAEPWVAKAYQSIQADPLARIAMLVLASVGSNWFRDHVFDKARVIFLNGRLQFVGHPTPYPKDLMLLMYGMTPGIEVWSWKDGLGQQQADD